jgi:hypothetical protein
VLNCGIRSIRLGSLVVLLGLVSACGGTTSPTSPSSEPLTTTGTTTYTYTTDVKPILNSDCIRCHNAVLHENGYDFTTYAGVRRAVTPGSAGSVLVRVVQPGQSMYVNFSGNRTQKAQVVTDWVVSSGAAE